MSARLCSIGISGCHPRPDRAITIEIPYLMQLIYLSFYATGQIFESQGFELFDFKEIPGLFFIHT